MGGTSRIAGSTILVLEDNPLIALDIAFLLEDEGATVVGPFRTLDQTMEALREDPPLRCAVLDYDLEPGTSEEAALALRARGVPVVFYSGSGAAVAELARRTGASVVEKPSRPGRLLEAIIDALSSVRRRP